MVGATSWLKLSTKQDFINNMEARIAYGDIDPLQDYRNLYIARLNWFNEVDGDGNPVTVESIEAGVTDDTHRVVPSQDAEGNDVFTQQELKLDPNALMFLKGFTLEEIEGILGM